MKELTLIEKKRLERCRDCGCQCVGLHGWFCEQLQDHCVNIIQCPEFEYDPSIYSKEEIVRMYREQEGNTVIPGSGNDTSFC